MIKVHYSTLQRVLDLLPARTGMGIELDSFLAELKQKGEDAVRNITANDADSSNVMIKVLKDKIDVN